MEFIIEKTLFKDVKYSILDFGAQSDTEFNNKIAIQKAIDYCSQQDGGIVVVPQGYYLSGPIELKDNVCLHLEEGAFLQFTKSKEEYPLFWTNYEGQKRIRAISPISAKNATNIAITGKGIIDGNGFQWRGIKKFKLTQKQWDKCLTLSPYVIPTKEGGIWYPTQSHYEGVIQGEPNYDDPKALELASAHYDMYRPVLVSFIECDRVLIEDVTLQNSPAWNVHPLLCKNFTMKNAVIKNKFYAQNGDGIDLESCENCEIAGSVFEVGDDGICIKSGKNREARSLVAPCKNVWIHDCKVYDAHGGFVVGSEMSRGVQNILVENCTFVGTDIGIRFKSAMGRGGVVENITIRNIHMANIVEEAMIFTMGYVLYTLEHEKSDIVETEALDDVPVFRNITVENILCQGAKIGIKINGLEYPSIYDLTLKNIKISASKAIETSRCQRIQLENVEIKTKNERFYFKNEVLSEINNY